VGSRLRIYQGICDVTGSRGREKSLQAVRIQDYHFALTILRSLGHHEGSLGVEP
jgi:hypothetical protein